MTRYLMTAFAALLLLGACSNDSVFEGISENTDRDAILEDSSSALSRGDYSYVISCLGVVYTTTAIDPEVSRLLASAYMGRTGLDFTLFMRHITGSSSTHPFDVVASMISSPYGTTTGSERYLSGNAVEGKKEDGTAYEIDLLETISRARRILETLETAGLASDDDIIQLGFASAAHFILHVGNQTANSLNTTFRYYSQPSLWKYGTVPVPINTYAYHYYKTSQSTDFKYRWYLVDPASYRERTLGGEPTTCQKDLLSIRDAIEAFDRSYPGQNDLRDALDAFLRSALGVTDGADISDSLILAYSSSGVYAFVNRLADAR
ncbi:MAG TPA: hypothetical protein PLW83_02850 [Deltaproteobacteria bacterium]|nr:hypothetical protein [Deltaproteobacteria bacterium]